MVQYEFKPLEKNLKKQVMPANVQLAVWKPTASPNM